ncbi:hypothetical protein Asch01_01389 [Acinetobacter schindleri]
MVDFIHNNKDLYGVDAICRILPIAASTYYRTLDLTVNPEHRAKRDLHDLHIDVPPLQAHELQSTQPVEDSATVRERVITAYELQIQRQNKLNMASNPKELEQFAPLNAQASKMFELAQQKLNLSARAYHRVLRVARSIADLAESPEIQTQHLSEALSYRGQ